MENVSPWNKMSTSSVCHVHPSRGVLRLLQKREDRSRMPSITPDRMELATSTLLVRSDRRSQRREISRTWKISSNASRTPRFHSVSKSLICHLNTAAFTPTAHLLTTGTSRHKLATQPSFLKRLVERIPFVDPLSNASENRVPSFSQTCMHFKGFRYWISIRHTR
jgi:hypothetical protein